MIRYVVGRLLTALPVLWGVSLVIFTMQKLLPGDAAVAILGPQATAQELTALRAEHGTPFNAEAVKVNLDRALDEKSPYFYSQLSIFQKRYIYQYIESYKVLDPFTIQLTNRVPFPDFLFQIGELGYAAFVSPTALQKWGNNDLAEHPVGTGPFRLVERVRGQKVVLERNPDYWGRKPYLNRIIFRPLPEAASRVVALQTGEADLIMVPPPDSIEQLKKAGFIVHQSPTAHIWYWNLCMNKEPLKDIRVRRAIQHAIDKEGLARNLMQGTVLPAHQMHAPGAPSHDPEFKMYEYNPEKAKQLLAEAGYPHGLKINYHPQSGWFEDAPLKGGPVWYAPAGGAVVGSPLPRAL